MQITLTTNIAPELDSEKQLLMDLLIDAHSRAATDNANASSLTFINALYGSGRMENAIAAAMLTIGAKHGPISDARIIYEYATADFIKETVSAGEFIPGFGNSFYKDDIDPVWKGVDRYLSIKFAPAHKRIWELHSIMESCGKKLYPNAALYSAAVCSICGVKPGTEVAIFAIARISAWASMSIA